MSDTDTLYELHRASRAWLDRAAEHYNAGESGSVAQSAAAIGHGYAALANAHGCAVTLTDQERARVDFPLDESDVGPVWPSARQFHHATLAPTVGPVPS